eukprot:TRINITY_DN1709_c0_g1_i2.p1 TRINITY_DN1709_c0_g1~~TRINITY_DN1709_c0_g1_i2.p1  ORF type:complete len:1180 (-),score=292.10 TRINITY_DN1709_c0_g1_i2:85-3624(-)
MFVYLSKKIPIPNGVNVRTVNWNSEQGWIACGGDDGLLKVLKLDSLIKKEKEDGGKGSGKSLSMNQTLEGHHGSVLCTTWNENYRKLTTSDQLGLIIVWMLHRGMWFEEMINNRNKSVVRDMHWTSDGQKICIAYEDGLVIVGSVDGNRLWGKELKSELALLCWSPDARSLVFATTGGQVHLYDASGNFKNEVGVYCNSDVKGMVQVIGIDWYDGAEGIPAPDAPPLALGFENGRLQLMLDEFDDKPILVDTGMRAKRIKWNASGTTLAVAGSATTTLPTGETRDVSMVQFYSPFGQHLRTLRVPGSGIQSISWEGTGLRLALAVDHFIYFANIRPDYKWGYFQNTLVYAFTRPDRKEHCVIFWDTETEQKHTKYVKQLLAIRAAGENCVLVTQTDDNSGQHILILCNAIGVPIESKYIDITPLSVAMTPTHVCVASEEVVYTWQYRTVATSRYYEDESSRRGRENIWHIDDVGYNSVAAARAELTVPEHQDIEDTICSIAASNKMLLVGRESGSVHCYSLPQIAIENKFTLRCRPHVMAINSNSRKFSIIDMNGVLTFFDMEARGENGQTGEHLAFERKDAWDMRWSDDNPELFAMAEKTRMFIFRGQQPEEPIPNPSSAYTCAFSDLNIKAIMLDEILNAPDEPDKSTVVIYETKSLRDTRTLLDTVGVDDTYKFISDHPHQRLWRLLAEAALRELNFNIADKAFVHCKDYQGIQFLKRLRVLDDPVKQKAEVAAYFRNFEEAESVYVEIDRKDLAIDLRSRLGDWHRVVQLVQSGGGDDELLLRAWKEIGDYFADRQKWAKAMQYYALAKDSAKLAECYYVLEDYVGLQKLIPTLPEGSPLLLDIGAKFVSVGMSEPAVEAFLKGGEVKAAVDCCVELNQWDTAVRLAEKHHFPQIQGLLSKYASHLLEKNKTLSAIELYKKARHHSDAANLLMRLGEECGRDRGELLLAKKLYVLAAIELDSKRKMVMDTSSASAAVHGLEAMLADDAPSGATGGGSNLLSGNPWKGAEAYHFLMLAQRQLYAGDNDAAMRTAIRLQEYEGILDPEQIYALVATTTYLNQYLTQCSKALMKLESMDDLSDEKKASYAELALEIFIQTPPADPSNKGKEKCGQCGNRVRDWQTSCHSCGNGFPGCFTTGRTIFSEPYIQCRNCKHKGLELETRRLTNCPLCHSELV